MSRAEFGLSEEVELREAVTKDAMEAFTNPNGFSGAEVTVGGDEMEIAGMLLDDWDLDPGLYLRANLVEFTVPVKVQVLLNEGGEIYYKLTFLEAEA